jgi:alpha-galactosidase
LGKQARVIRRTEDELVLLKPLEDGAVAVGLFNLSEKPRRIAVSFADLGLSGKKRVRDVWRQKDLAPVSGEISAGTERHGVAFYRLR